MLPIKRFVVKGHSMEPLIKEGQGVLINRLAYLFSQPKVSDIVALNAPNIPNKLLLKRVEKVLKNNKYIVVGINKVDSTDSRQFGWVSSKDILGKVWLRY